MVEPYVVAIIVDPSFGARLRELPLEMPVWIVATAVNRAAAEAIWSERPRHSHLDGITTFQVTDGERPTKRCEQVLGEVDLHHGEFSHDPPYSVVRVIGTALDQTLEEAFREYGFSVFDPNSEGFIARAL